MSPFLFVRLRKIKRNIVLTVMKRMAIYLNVIAEKKRKVGDTHGKQNSMEKVFNEAE